MDRHQAQLLRDMLAGTGLAERTDEFARALRTDTRTPGGLLVFGPPDDEPWHVTAHLADESRFADVPELNPTLVRWAPRPGDAPHLSIGLDRLAQARRGESLLVVSEEEAPVPLLEHVDDARRRGAGIYTIDTGDRELESLARESIRVDADVDQMLSFEGAQHLVSLATGAAVTPTPKGLRARIGRLLDAISGPSN